MAPASTPHRSPPTVVIFGSIVHMDLDAVIDEKVRPTSVNPPTLRRTNVLKVAFELKKADREHVRAKHQQLMAGPSSLVESAVFPAIAVSHSLIF